MVFVHPTPLAAEAVYLHILYALNVSTRITQGVIPSSTSKLITPQCRSPSHASENPDRIFLDRDHICRYDDCHLRRMRSAIQEELADLSKPWQYAMRC